MRECLLSEAEKGIAGEVRRTYPIGSGGQTDCVGLAGTAFAARGGFAGLRVAVARSTRHMRGFAASILSRLVSAIALWRLLSWPSLGPPWCPYPNTCQCERWRLSKWSCAWADRISRDGRGHGSLMSSRENPWRLILKRGVR